jgi:ribonucleoside-diphosphate reductase alpha chain
MRTRKIGLGVMGFSDLLLLRGERYGSAESERIATRVIACVEREARRASEALGQERGVFPAYEARGPARRNASLLAIAPTGTLRLLAGCSGGLEPWISPVVCIRTSSGDALRWVDRWLLDWLETRASSPAAVVDALAAGLEAASLPGLAAADWPLLRRAHEVPPEAQLSLQARFQAHVDGSVSKTIHLPPDASAGDIIGLIHRAHELGCKGVAFWRATAAASPPSVTCTL